MALSETVATLTSKNQELTTQLENDTSRIEDLEFQIEEQKFEVEAVASSEKPAEPVDAAKKAQGDDETAAAAAGAEDLSKKFMEETKVLKDQLESLNIELKQLK